MKSKIRNFCALRASNWLFMVVFDGNGNILYILKRKSPYESEIDVWHNFVKKKFYEKSIRFKFF